jgi:hypothetical protein
MNSHLTELNFWQQLSTESGSYVTTDGQPASLSWNKAPIWGLRLLLSDSCGFVDVGRPLWREDGSVVYNCCWPSPEQSFSGPSRVGLVTVFYCLRFEASLFVVSYDSQGYGDGIRPLLHTGYYYLLPSNFPLYSLGADPTKTPSYIVTYCFRRLLISCLAMNVLFLRSLATAGMCLPSRCLAVALYVTLCYLKHNCFTFLNVTFKISLPREITTTVLLHFIKLYKILNYIPGLDAQCSTSCFISHVVSLALYMTTYGCAGEGEEWWSGGYLSKCRHYRK